MHTDAIRLPSCGSVCIDYASMFSDSRAAVYRVTNFIDTLSY